MSNRKLSRRQFLKMGGAAIAGYALTSKFGFRPVQAQSAAAGLSDPAVQPKFVNFVPDALDPGFIYQPNAKGIYDLVIRQTKQETGLVNNGGQPLQTTVWGYGTADDFVSWPGRTFIVQRGEGVTKVKWDNQLYRNKNRPLGHLLPVDTSLHWAYSLHGYTQYSIDNDGVPIITHLHGGHTDYEFDGNPEFFYSPDYEIVGPQWAKVSGGLQKIFKYDNDVPAGNLWYHDHALGITRLNVYAGMAGFYFVRDDFDTGTTNNDYGLPAWPYEKAYAIQDRMFTNKGELFYPAFPGDPFYADFITGEGAILPPEIFPGGGPTALAEFFGDHIVVNGKIWPKEEVEPRQYRMHLLNGTDSRFMVFQFRAVPMGETTLDNAGDPLPFTVIGSDQGLASSTTDTEILLSEPGSRYDIVIDFSDTDLAGKRIILENLGGDAPFGGDYGDDLAPEDLFPNRQTDRIMAFDVVLPFDESVAEPTLSYPGYAVPIVPNTATRTRKVALFEGKDEFGRLQPLLGTAEPATDYQNNPIYWPDEPEYAYVGLMPDQQMEGSIAWHSPTTENPELDAIEEWEIWNLTGDAHPVHLHLVHFEILDRQEINFDSNADGDGFIPDDATPNNDGIYLVSQPTVQHNSVAGDDSTYGIGFRIVHPSNPIDAYGPAVPQPAEYVENAPKDMVTALPGQITRIRAKFDKPGRYVWHCHILSHEDHEMMRVLHVGPGA